MTLTVTDGSKETKYVLFEGDKVTLVVLDRDHAGSVKTIGNPVFGFDSHDLITWEDAAWQ